MPTSTRRDSRTELPPATATVEFAWNGPDAPQLQGEVTTISATGLAFTLADDPAIEVGTLLAPARVRIREKIVQGDLTVSYSRPTEGSRIEFGCLFYPESLEDSAGWMAFVTQESSEGSDPPPRLALRCSNCHATIWICGAAESSHTCPLCSQEYGFGKPIRRGELAGLHERARGLAAELGIDLPSAVSMLLGILTLSEVRDILDSAPPAEPVTETPGEGRRRRFDKAFLPAMEAGTLTEAQAVQRGNREAFAQRLVARHRISLDDAYAVADNRTTLLNLVRTRTAGARITATYARPASPTRVVVVAGLAGIALLIGIVIVTQFDRAFNHPTSEPEPRPRVSDVRPSGAGTSKVPVSSVALDLARAPVDSYARVQANERGEILRVEATNPENVLLAFCKSNGSGIRLEPVGVVPTDPPSDSARLGLLRSLEAEEHRVVVIRRDPQTRRWFLGNVGDPDSGVSTFPAPERLMQAASNAR